MDMLLRDFSDLVAESEVMEGEREGGCTASEDELRNSERRRWSEVLEARGAGEVE